MSDVIVTTPPGLSVVDVEGVVVGPPGPQGPPGKSLNVIPYVLDASMDGLPATGMIQYDNANPTQVTTLRMSYRNSSGDNLQALVFVINQGDFIVLQSATRPTQAGERFTVTGTPIQQVDHMDIPVAWHSGGLALMDDEPIYFNIAYVGPQGPKGDKGDQGDPGPEGPPGTGSTVTRHCVQVRNTVAQDIPSGAKTPINFDIEDFDASGMHDVGAPSRLVAPSPASTGWAGLSRYPYTLRAIAWRTGQGTGQW